MLTPADEIASVEGGSLGTAVLSVSGQAEIIPPARIEAAAPSKRKNPARPTRPIRVWIDFANSPHVQFFGPIIAEIEARGHSVIITARDYAQTIGLLDQAGLDYATIGHHGGRTTVGKLVAIEQRARELASHARQSGADIAVHHNSYAQSIAARALRIPAVTLMDYEYQPANHVSFRLSDLVLVPESIPRRSLARYGAGWRLRRYPGLKEEFYVASMASAGDEASWASTGWSLRCRFWCSDHLLTWPHITDSRTLSGPHCSSTFRRSAMSTCSSSHAPASSPPDWQSRYRIGSSSPTGR